MNPNTPANPAPHAPAPRGAVLAVGLGAGIDLALTLALLARGWTQGGAHIAGFAAGTLAALLIAAWAGRGGPAPTAAFSGAARSGWRLVGFALALGLRGGVLATLLAWGLPPWLAVTVGVALAWGLRAFGERYFFTARFASAPLEVRALRAAGALALAVLLLHLAYPEGVSAAARGSLLLELRRPACPGLPGPSADGGLADCRGRGAVRPWRGRHPHGRAGLRRGDDGLRLAARAPAGGPRGRGNSGGAGGDAALCVFPGRPADHAGRAAGRRLGGGAVLPAPRPGRRRGAGLGGRGRGAGHRHAVEVHHRAAGAGGAAVLPAGCARARLVPAPAALRGGAAGGPAVHAGGLVELHP